ncbi:MAG: EamA family transporter [Candidatus Aenigmarchaeota archaeon]|nr:EamA family transporter [Candidatus Aenigmarchaeota archaeon]
MTDIFAIALGVASTIASAIGILLLKMASRFGFMKMVFSRHFILGGVLFLFSGFFMILALKTEELSLLFPITSLTYIWVTLLSKAYLKEDMNKWKICGVALIVLGVMSVTLL